MRWFTMLCFNGMKGIKDPDVARKEAMATVSAVATVMMALLCLLLASASPIDEPVVLVARSPLSQELIDLLLYIQEEASIVSESSHP